MSAIKLSRRAANYSKAELDCLLSYIEGNTDLVGVKLGRQYETADDIRLAWEELAEKITQVAGFFGPRRTGQEVKRKWSDLKSRVKAKAASLAIDSNKPLSNSPNLKLTPAEERVLAIISQDIDDHSHSQRSEVSGRGNMAIMPAVKVFSFHHESNSAQRSESDSEDGERSKSVNLDESEILEEIKLSGNKDKKRRISKAFSADRKGLGFKKLKMVSEEEQLQELCNAQQEINTELHSMKEILKKCQLSIEKIALLKRAELRLKCAKYGVDFGDLFD